MNLDEIQESGVVGIEAEDNSDKGEEEEQDSDIPKTIPVRWFKSEDDAMSGIFEFESIESLDPAFCYLDLNKFCQKFRKPPCRAFDYPRFRPISTDGFVKLEIVLLYVGEDGFVSLADVDTQLLKPHSGVEYAGKAYRPSKPLWATFVQSPRRRPSTPPPFPTSTIPYVDEGQDKDGVLLSSAIDQSIAVPSISAKTLRSRKNAAFDDGL